MYKVAVIGDKDSIYGFASIGMEIFPTDTAEDASATLRKIADSGYGVVFITEQLAAQMQTELDRYRELLLPAIIPIPGVSGNTGLGMSNVSKFVEQAVGSDILSDA